MPVKNNERWYEIPNNHLPEDDYCFLVTVPKDIKYAKAFFDSWYRLTTWLPWEKDDEKRAKQVAQRWRKNGYPLMVCCDIKEALDEDGCMAINITVNCKCGGGCGGGGGGQDCLPVTFNPEFPSGEDFNYDDLVDIVDTPDNGVDYPDGFESREEYDAYKCQLAGELIEDWIDSLDSLATLGSVGTIGGGALLVGMFSSISFGSAGLGGVFGGLVAIGLSATAAVAIMVAALMAAIGGGFVAYAYFSELAYQMRQTKDEILCQLFNATTTAQAHQILVNYTTDSVANIVGGDVEQEGLFAKLVDDLIDVLIPEELPKLLFSAARQLLSEEVQYDCSGCTNVSGDNIFIDFDTFAPDPSGVFLDTAGVDQEPNGNWRLWLVAHQSGNAGQANWNQGAVLDMIPTTEDIIVDRIEWDMSVADGNDDLLGVYVGDDNGGGSLGLNYSGSSFDTSWTHVVLDIPDLLFTHDYGLNGFRVTASNVGVRQPFYFDNIRIWYHEA